MLYEFFQYMDQNFNLIGAGVFQYISFRAGMAAIFSLIISILFGKKIINILKQFQLSENIRDLDLKGQNEKKGTPTMGGVIIIISILIPTLLFARLDNIYILLMIFVTAFMGIIGGIDDYLKISKKNKEGLKGRFKIVGQIIVGLVVTYVIVENDSVVVREFLEPINQETISRGIQHNDTKDLITTIPFVKDNEFRYEWLLPSFLENYSWIIYALVIIFIIVSVSNGANITDGLDGLAAGLSAIMGITL